MKTGSTDMGNKDKSNNYSKGRDAVERDLLAEHRTTLANERTLLAYVRTALTFFVIGATFIKFFGYPFFEIVGWIFIPVGAILLVKGIISFRNMKSEITKARGAERPS